MEFFDHGTGSEFFGPTLRRYAEGGVTPAFVKDGARGIQKPRNGGLNLTGCFDLTVDGQVYLGLSVPFVIPAIPGAAQMRAFPGTASITTDHLLQPGGARSTAPADGFVLGDNDIWSVGTDA